MLSVLGAGFAYPETLIDNSLLLELVKEYEADSSNAQLIIEQSGIAARATSLSLDYIRSTANLDTSIARKVCHCTPTDLAVRAAQMALTRAGIEASQLGLVLGDTSTGHETCPSEAQRVAGALKLKIPSYDLSASLTSIALQLDILTSWREETLPEYILCFSSATPTQSINYARGLERFYFSDGAGAFVVSTRHPGKLTVSSASYATHPGRKEGLHVPLFGFIEMGAHYLNESLLPDLVRTTKRALSDQRIDPSSVTLINSQLDNPRNQILVNECEVDPLKVWSSASAFGIALGASPYCVLAEKWDQVQDVDNLVIAVAGAGSSSGYVCLKSQEA